MVSLFISMCAAWPAFGADKPLVVEVWPGTAPEESGNIKIHDPCEEVTVE
jgi:hypothetical protein